VVGSPETDDRAVDRWMGVGRSWKPHPRLEIPGEVIAESVEAEFESEREFLVDWSG
jgi:hypothetical protein